ncbi:MAG: glycosyltransferase family 2 protein, partial [Planctomycetota bacterium]
FIDPLVQPLTEDPRLLVGVGATKQCGWKFIVGWLVAMHRDALQDIGFLDEDFPGTFEDVDYSVRAQKAGYKLYKFGRGVIPVAHLSLGRLNRHLHTGKRLLLEKHGRPDS